MLAALLWAPGTALPAETIVERVWGDGAPAQALSSVYAYIARLRALLDRHGGPDLLCRTREGYRCSASSG